MKEPSRIRCVLAALSSAALLAFLAASFVSRPIPKSAYLDGNRIAAAVNDYRKARVTKGQSVARWIPLRLLVKEGYLAPFEIQALGEVEVSLSLSDLDETKPQDFFLYASYPNGGLDVILGDGSVQSLPFGKVKDQLKTAALR